MLAGEHGGAAKRLIPFALGGIAGLWAREGHPHQALTLIALVERNPTIELWVNWYIARLKADLVAALSPAVAAQAQAEGQALDLWETAQALLDTGARVWDDKVAG